MAERLQQLESVSLSCRDLTVAFSWSLFNWIADVACLALSWVFISAIGRVVFFFVFRTETDVHPDAGLDDVDQSEAVSDAEPKHDS